MKTGPFVKWWYLSLWGIAQFTSALAIIFQLVLFQRDIIGFVPHKRDPCIFRGGNNSFDHPVLYLIIKAYLANNSVVSLVFVLPVNLRVNIYSEAEVGQVRKPYIYKSQRVSSFHPLTNKNSTWKIIMIRCQAKPYSSKLPFKMVSEMKKMMNKAE